MVGMAGSEEVREWLVLAQQENERLRVENAHANLLIDALEALLCDSGSEPFAGVFGALRAVFGFTQSLVLVESEEDGGLDCAVADPPDLQSTRWPVGRLFRKVLSGRVTATFTNEGIEEWGGEVGDLSAAQPALYVPMRVRDRRGLLMLLRPAGDAGFDRSHVALARKFALLASHALAARRAQQSEVEGRRLRALMQRLQETQEALHHRANHDELTDLPNRSFMQELVEQMLAVRDGRQGLALAFVDIDDFKQINDLHNHGVGDVLLRSVARRIRASIRESDRVGRISGDEFLIVFENFQSMNDLEALARRILDQVRLPFLIDGVEIRTSASIGIALYPDHGRDYDTLRRSADIAMYKAKTAAKGSLACFDKEMGSRAAARLSLEQRLRAAVRGRQFRAALQPKIDLRTMSVVGFEALARWVEADGTVRSPAAFVPAATEFGLLDDIAAFVLQDTIRSLPRLDAAFGDATHVSLNVSAKQASQPAFIGAILAELKATPKPERFTLELTEDALVAAEAFCAHVLPSLREIGVRVSIDDFGTGYSSLSTLADITADELKVDRSFISGIEQRPRSQSILKAMESLGNALGMTMVAEGVETMAEVDYLLGSSSIRLAQGFLFSRPHFVEHLVDADWVCGGRHLQVPGISAAGNRPPLEGELAAAE